MKTIKPTKYDIEYANSHYKSERGRNSYLAKRVAEYDEIINNPCEVIEFTAKVQWHKSRTWGYCPTAEVWVTTLNALTGETDTTYHKEGATGYGYDKLSSAIAYACGDCKAWHNTIKKNLKHLNNGTYRGYAQPSEYTPYYRIEWAGRGRSVIRAFFKALGGQYYENGGDAWDLIEWRKKK